MNIKKISILVCEPMAAEGLSLLQKNPAFNVDVCLELSYEELSKKIADYDCLLVRSQTKVDNHIINLGKNLKLIGRAGVGIDNIDIVQAQKNHIAVINTPSGNSIATAELALGLMLSLARRLPFAHQHVKNNLWDRGSFKGKELFEKTLGIIGFGNVGKNLAKRAAAFEMKILVYDPLLDSSPLASGAKAATLDETLSQADFLSLHCVLNENTKNIINQKNIALMKKGVMLINTARGELIEDEALIAGLDSGHIAFAAIDVFRHEPPTKDIAFINHPRVMVTPHLGASTEEAQKRVSNQLAEQTVAFFMGQKNVTRVV